MPSFTLNVNQQPHQVEVDGDTPLLWVLRDELQLVGTKYGCGVAQCGACTVHVDGSAMRSCSLPISRVGEASIQTIEGLEDKVSKSLRKAWVEHDVPQCGYCQAGQIMSAASLLQDNPNPTEEDIDAYMQGNLCRCGTYLRIKKAIQSAAQNI